MDSLNRLRTGVSIINTIAHPLALLSMSAPFLLIPSQSLAIEEWPEHVINKEKQGTLTSLISQTLPSSSPSLLEQGIQYIEQGQLDAARSTLQSALMQAREQGDRPSECLALVHISTVSIGMGNSAQGLTEAQQALTIARELDNPDLIAKALSSMGIVYALQSDYETAIRLYQDALNLDNDAPGTNRQLWNRLGLTYSWQANYEQAIQAYEQALRFAEADGNTERIATTLGFLADAHAELGDSKQAIAYYQQNLALTNTVTSQISSFSGLGHLYLTNNQLTDAVEHYEQALSLIRQIGDVSQEYPLLNTLASAQLGLGQFADARDNGMRSRDLATADNAPLFEMNAWSILGQAYAGLNQVDEAIAAHEQALALAKTLAEPQQEVLSLTSLGSLYQGIGQYLDAIDAFEQVLVLTAQTQESYGTLAEDALIFLGQIHILLGDYSRAIAYFQENLSLVQKDSDLANDIAAYQKIGDAYYASGRYSTATEYYQQALNQARASNNSLEEVRALTNLVSGYRSLHQFVDARQHAEEAVQIAQSLDDPWTQGIALWELGNVQLLVQDDQTIDTFQSLVALSDNANGFPQSLALRSLGEAHLTFGNPDNAIALFQQALVLDQQVNDTESEGHTLSDLGRAYQQAGDLNAAEAAFRQAVSIWEGLRSNLGDRDDIKVSLLTRQRTAYQNLQTVLVAQDKPLEALEVAEQGRARALADLLSQNVGAQIGDFQTGDTQTEAAPIIQSPTLAEIVAIAQTQNATLVEYSETLEALYIWVIKPSGEIIFEQVEMFNPAAVLPAAASQTTNQPTMLSSAIAETRSASGITLGNRPRAYDRVNRFNETLETLYTLLIEPIEDHLPSQPEERVIFIPQGELFQVAFPALRNQEGQYLIETHTLLTAPSIQTLGLTQSLRQSQGQTTDDTSTTDVLVVGNPVMPVLPNHIGVPLASLPGAEEEALTVADILTTSALTGAAATEPVVTHKMKTASIIHLATHGLLDYGSPEVSLVRDVPGAIALAPDPRVNASTGDGLLTASEIMALSLQAELVVLSACNTGRGDITADGVIGLSRALMTAGVPSVVVSLWAVPDAPTSLLMAEFYRQLDHTPDKAQALRQAMLLTLQTHPNPVDWAAFTLIGEAQ